MDNFTKFRSEVEKLDIPSNIKDTIYYLAQLYLWRGYERGHKEFKELYYRAMGLVPYISMIAGKLDCHPVDGTIIVDYREAILNFVMSGLQILSDIAIDGHVSPDALDFFRQSYNQVNELHRIIHTPKYHEVYGLTREDLDMVLNAEIWYHYIKEFYDLVLSISRAKVM